MVLIYKSEGTMPKFKMLLSMFIFGTLGVFITNLNMPSAVIAALRAVIATVFILLYLLVSGQKIDFSAIKKNAPVLVISGAAIGFNWILLFEAYRYTTVAVATLCYYMAPVFVIVVSPFILKERLTISKLFCAAAAVLGAVLISGASKNSGYLGILFGLLAAMLYASVVIMNKFIKNLKNTERTLCQMGSAAMVMLIYVIITNGFSGLVFDAKAAGLILTVGIIHTGIAYILFFAGVASLPAQTSAVLSYIDPVTAVILSGAMLGQPITYIQIIGAVLILGSTLINEALSYRGKINQ